MKKISFVLFLLTIFAINLNAQVKEQYCGFGITFEISNNPSWGYGEPIVRSVEPYSPADKAGLKVDDIIMEVNGSATYLRNYKTIESWILTGTTSEIRLTVRNVDTYFKEYTVQRECRPVNSVNEFALATSYSFYSIENTTERAFYLPLKVDPNANVQFSDYHTFSFIEDTDASAMDHYINAQIEKALAERGLVKTSDNPDILVQSYYSFQPNLKYDPTSKSRSVKTWRFDPDTKQMIQLPILSGNDPNAEIKGEFILELGIRFFDKKYIDTEKLTQIWDCRTKEFLTEEMDMQEYARIHSPLMMMQFPYSNPKTVAKYTVNFKKFNYTGLNYDLKDIANILYIDLNSPAAQAGLKVGDVISKINDDRFDFTTSDLENGYRRFIVETMKLRDPKTKFIDANGFPDCMYWAKSNYLEVEKAFKEDAIYALSFAYLYSYEKYISGTTSANTVEVEYKRNGTKNKLRITPQVQSSVVVRAL